MAKAGHKGMQPKRGMEHVGDTPPDAYDQDDFANEIKGRNSLQAEDQGRVHNQRQRLPDEKRETEGLIESFDKTTRSVAPADSREGGGKGRIRGRAVNPETVSPGSSGLASARPRITVPYDVRGCFLN